MTSILLVEDEPELGRILMRELRRMTGQGGRVAAQLGVFRM